MDYLAEKIIKSLPKDKFWTFTSLDYDRQNHKLYYSDFSKHIIAESKTEAFVKLFNWLEQHDKLYLIVESIKQICNNCRRDDPGNDHDLYHTHIEALYLKLINQEKHAFIRIENLVEVVTKERILEHREEIIGVLVEHYSKITESDDIIF